MAKVFVLCFSLIENATSIIEAYWNSSTDSNVKPFGKADFWEPRASQCVHLPRPDDDAISCYSVSACLSYG